MAHKHRTRKHVAKGYMIGVLNKRDRATRKDEPVRLPQPTNTDTIATTIRKPFRLLDLPDELILRILDFSVVHSSYDCPIDICRPTKRPAQSRNGAVSGAPYKKGASDLVQPALTRTCRFLRYEGLKKFYTKNYFLLETTLANPTEGTIRWLKCLKHTPWIRLLSLIVVWYDISGKSPIRQEDMSDIVWDDFLQEVDYLYGEMLYFKARSPLYLCTAGNKIVLDRRGDEMCYFLRFKQPEQGSKVDCREWIDCKDVLKEAKTE